MRNKKRLLSSLIFLILAAALWALNIELTYEHNVRRGIPADFHLLRAHTVLTWRT